MSRRGGRQQDNGVGGATGTGDAGQAGEAGTPRRRRGSRDDRFAPVPYRPPVSKEQRVLFVACEGEVTEPQYLDHLNLRYGDGGDGERQPFLIHPISAKNGLIPSRAVAAVRDLKQAEGEEAWVLFDRDEHHDIPKALREAAAANIQVCFSHPSFDLWLLLHFQAMSGRQSGSNKDIVKKLRAAHPAYKSFDVKNDKSVKGDRRDALDEHDAAKKAVAHARSLVNQCEHGGCKADNRKPKAVSRGSVPESDRKWAARSGHAEDCPVLKRDPSTDVWRLLVSLGIVDDRSR
ncbi:RloB family protein [Streptomyces sp. MB09-02B]|uniref:RloB family protein n=1 Tax=Streptomyces sp. MB09-02B TaxID=3028667 RepID=UPI0029B3C2F8|nr:RloB family protein [Streptomyces sp. MB09-02B]MDX3640404.1 RloB family protein [Streptomyces sp. MB09-02B]